MNQNQLKYEVELGLNQAQQQAEALHNLLNKSVKPDTSAFKSINEQLSSATRLALKLKGSLDTAFKTSNSSNKFLNDLEKLFDSLSSISNQFGYLKGKDLVDFDSSSLKELRKNLEDTEAEIKKLESHKLGTTFSGDTKELENFRTVAAEIKKDFAKMTFDEFSNALSKAMGEAEKNVNKARKAVEDFQNLTNDVKIGNIANVISDLNSAINGAAGGITKAFTKSSAVQVKDQIRELYEANGLSTRLTSKSKDVTERIGEGSTFAETISKQTADIEKALEAQKVTIDAKRTALEEAKNKIDEIINKKTITNEDGTKISTVVDKAKYIKEQILKEFSDIDFGADFTKGKGLSKWADNIKAILEQQANELNVDTIKQKMIEQLTNIVEGAEYDRIADNTNNGLAKIRQAIESFFNDKGIDISAKDNPIKKVLDSLKTGYNLDTFASDLAKALSSLSANYDDQLKGLQEKADQASQALERLKQADKTFQEGQSGSENALKAKKEAAEEYKQSIADLLNELLKSVAAEAQQSNSDAGSGKYQKAAQAVREFAASLQNLEGKQKVLSNVQSAVTRWMGFYQVLNLAKKAVNDMKQHIEELDEVMTKIAVVTNFSQDDLWNQISQYSEIARQYGVAIKGVYEVSQIYYQQGLNKGDVMGLTTETLKMARIAGLDYATAADYMTTAIRGFQMEMSEANRVTDVFSALAASTASSTEELAVAISKTAASAASVGASFEATSAMMATMIATTRESATNIGTALKSIIARYGELKENLTGTDAEGEAYSLNKVDKALQSVGISIHDAAGQFRDFDDVILELGKAWDTIDKNTQRYIATVMAGNRQQSRFLALVSNVDEYKRALEIAQDAEGSGELQTLKTLDSIDAKIERMKVTIQEFYTSSGLQDLYKTILDTITNVISAANDLPKVFGNIPAYALTIGANLIRIIKSILLLAINSVRTALNQAKGETSSITKSLITSVASYFNKLRTQIKESIAGGMRDGAKEGKNAVQSETADTGKTLGGGFGTLIKSSVGAIGTYIGSALNAIGGVLTISGLNKYGASTSPSQDRQAGTSTLIGAGTSILGDIASGAAMGAIAGAGTGPGALVTGIVGGVIGGIKGVVSNFATLQSATEMLNVSLAREMELKQKEVDQTATRASEAQGDTKALNTAFIKLSQLKEAAYDSAEAMEEYHSYMNQLAESYPELVTSMDNSGNKIIEVTNLENALAESRLNTARATIAAAQAELEQSELQKQSYDNFNSQIELIYSRENNEQFNPAQLAVDLQPLQMKTRGANSVDINSIIDPYEKIIKAYHATQVEDDAGLKGLKWSNKGGFSASNNYEAIFRDPENFKTLIGYAVSQGSTTKKTEESARNNFQQALSKLKEENENINLAEVTGNKNITEADDVLKLNYSEMLDAVNKAKRWAADQLKHSSEVIDSLTEAAFNTQVEEQVLEDAANTEKFNEKDRAKLTKYTSLFTSFSDQLFNSNEAVNSEYNKQRLEQFEQWIVENEDLAAELKSIDYDQIKNTDAQTIASMTGLDATKDAWIIEMLQDKYIQMTKQTRESFTDSLKESIFKDKTTGEVDQSKVDFFTDLTDGIGDSIIPTLIPQLQSQLQQYKKLKDEGYTITANSYLDGIEQLYTGISQITDQELLDKVNTIVSSTDLQDQEALQAAIDSIDKLSNVPQDIKDALQSLFTNINTNIVIQAAQLTDSAVELAGSIKKSFDNLGKGMDFDDAIKIANEIYSELTAEQRETINLTDLYKFDEQLGQWVISEQAIQLQLNSLTEDYDKKTEDLQARASLQQELLNSLISGNGATASDRQNILDSFLKKHNITGDEAESYNILLEQWSKGVEEGQDPTALYQELLTQVEQITENDLAAAESLLKNSAMSYLASFDWAAIAGGSANEANTKAQLTVLLQSMGIENVDETVNQLYTNALNGNVEEMNKLLAGTGFQINTTNANNIIKSNVDQYKNAIDEITTKPIANWSTETQQLVDQLKSEGTLASDVDTTAITTALYTNLKALIGTGNYTLAEYNNDIAALTTKIQGLGKEKATIDLLKDGFSLEDFSNYLNSYFEGIGIDTFFQDGKAIGDFSGLIELDENGIMQVVEGKEAEVLAAFNNALTMNISSESKMWKGYLQDSVDKGIADRAAASSEKKAAAQLKSLSTAGVGEEVNISAIDSTVKDALGLEGDTYTVVSEAARDSLLKNINQALIDAQDDPTLKATLEALKAQVEPKYNKFKTTTNIISKTTSRDQAKALMIAMGETETSDANIEAYMTNLGFKWNSWTEEFEADANTLAGLRGQIDTLKAENVEGKNDKQIKALEAQYQKLSLELEEDPMRDALNNLLANYEDVSDDVLATFASEFGITDLTDYYTEDVVTGNKKVNLEKIKEAVGEDYAQYFDNIIIQMADAYINNASKATSLVSSGTSSFADMDAFTKAYNEMMKLEGDAQKTSADLFSYSSLLSAWQLDPAVLRAYVQAQADALREAGKLDPDDVSDWVDSQTKDLLASNVDISSFLSAEDKSSTGEAYKKLAEQMREYYKNILGEDSRIDKIIDDEINNLKAGGTAAVAEVKAWAAHAGREATTSEIEAAFSSAINELDNAMEALAEVSVGQITTGKLKEILQKAGKVDSNGVVTSVEDMASVYENIYKEMQATAGVTTTGLNSAYAKVLTAKEQGDIDAISAMGDAFGMTYDALGELIGKTGESLEQWMKDNSNLFESIGGGKIRITDFTAFAENRGWEAGSEEYTSAFKAYNDSLIEYNKKVSDQIKDEFNALTEIDLSQGEAQVNLTRIAEAGWSDSLEQLATDFGATFKDGILTLSDSADLSGFVAALGDLGVEAGDLLESEVQALKARNATKDNAELSEALSNIASSYENISIDMVAALAKALGVSYDTVAEKFGEIQPGGTYKTDLSTIQQLINGYRGRISESAYEDAMAIVVSQYDSILGSFGDVTGYVTEGTTSMTGMKDFADQLSELTGKTYDVESLFNYNAELNTFKLTTDGLKTYIQAQKAELEKLGLSGKAINDYINSQTRELIQANIDITSVLESSGAEKQKASSTLISQIKDLYESQGKQLERADADRIMAALNAGGEAAVEIVKELKGEFATADELKAAYDNSLTVKLRNAIEELSVSVGDTVSGIAKDILTITDGFTLVELEDGTAVIEAVGDMAQAYAVLYEVMKENAVSTTSDLNNTYAQFLTARSQKNVDALETLESADGITYEAFAELLNKYKHSYEDALSQGFAEDTGFGKIRITDFSAFADYMEWDINSPEYMEAYSNWVDSMIESRDETVKSLFQEKATNELSSLTEAKAGQPVNVSYLSKIFSSIGQDIDSFVSDYGANVENGILTLEAGADIPGLIQAVADRAAQAGAILPEQMAKLADAVEDMLSSITSIVSNGIKGNLNNQDAQKLNTWYRQQQANNLGVSIDDSSIRNLDMTKTSEGFKLSNDAAKELYFTIKEIDALQGEVVFEELKDNLIATEDAFKSVQSATIYTQGLTRDLRGAQMVQAGVTSSGGHTGQVKMFDQMNGNVDLYNRTRIERPDIGEGVYSTLETATLDSRNFETDIPFVMNITPIPPDAQTFEDIMSEAEVDEYVQSLLDQNPIDGNMLLELDKVENGGKGLIINLREEEAITDEIVENESQRAQELHEVAEVYESIKAGEEFNTEKIDQYKEELALVQKIQNIRATTEDESFNFMDNEIPSGQNNPLNYWNNWVEAYEKIHDATTGSNKGYMEYQDFYNIITEMNNLVALTDDAVTLGHDVEGNAIELDGTLESAAALIEKGAGALSATADGSLKVDLSGIGIDFEAGANDMNSSVNEGINALAQSQIDMLDSMIKLLEVIVAMEKLGDVDIDQSGSLELGEIFQVDINGSPITNEDGLELYTEEFSQAAQNILDFSEEVGHEDLKQALQDIRINGISLHDLFEDATDGVKDLDIGAEAYTAAVNALYKASLSDDYDLDNIGESLYKILEQSGMTECEIDVGDKTFYIKSGTSTVIDWSNEEVVSAAEKAFDSYIEGHKDELKDLLPENPTIKNKVRAIQTLLEEGKIEGEAEQELTWQMQLLTGEITITEDKVDGKTLFTGTYKGQKFKNADKAQVEAAIKKAQEIESQGFSFEVSNLDGNIEVKTLQKIGKAKIYLQKDENGNDVWVYNNVEYSTLDSAIAAAVADGNADASVDGVQYTTDSGETFEARYNSALNIGYAYSITGGYYVYKQQKFKTLEDMYEYINKVEKLLQTGDIEITDADGDTQVITDGNLIITRNMTTGETIYTLDGITFTDPVALGEYEAKKRLAAGEGSEPVPLADGGVGLTFTQSGYTVNMAVSSDGTIKYTVTIGELGTFTAWSEDGLKAALATAAKLEGGQISDSDAEGGANGAAFTFTSKDGISVTASFNGTVTVDEGDANSQKAKEIVAAANASLQTDINNETSTSPVTASVSSVELDASGATVTLNNMPTSATIGGSGEGGAASYTPEATVTNTDVTTSGVTVKIGEGITPDVTSVAEAIVTALENAINAATLNVNPTVSYGGGDNSGSDNSGGNNPSGVDTSGLSGITDVVNALNSVKSEEFTSIATATSNTKSEAVVTATDSINSIKSLATVTVAAAINSIKSLATIAAATAINSIKSTEAGNSKDAINAISSTEAGNTKDAINAIVSTEAGKAQEAINAISSTEAGNSKDAINAISSTEAGKAKDAINGISSTAVTKVAEKLNSLKASISVTSSSATASARINVSSAKGNMAMARGTRTLMGELGPELVVSRGRYFVVGQAGAEFVDLDKDAIVFNHQQTQRLLTQGEIGSRGLPFTNETNAISYAKGNVEGDAKAAGIQITNSTGANPSHGAKFFKWDAFKIKADVESGSGSAAEAKGTIGPAMASASAALAALKQLRAMWQSLQNATIQDFAGAGGSGGGGGSDSSSDMSAYLADLERWYKYLQKIDELETKINYEEAKRSRIASSLNHRNGKAYYDSQRKSLDMLSEEVKSYELLQKKQKEYFDERRAQLNSKNYEFSSLYEFDENGQLTYKKNGYAKLAKLNERDSHGQLKMTAEEQYNYIVNKLGISAESLKYGTDGQETAANDDGSLDYETLVQNFWDKMEADREEMQSLHDSINEAAEKQQELEQQRNELLKAIEDNQRTVEENVLEAIVDSRQRQIDDAQDERDALEKSNDKFINGLTNALNKEREARESREASTSLEQKRRKLAVLQRTGGSASEITSLQSEIEDESYDLYLEKQQEQIDKIQEASDKQLEKMDMQIELMQEQLDYEQAHGLLWDEVSEVMAGTAESITEFITTNNSEWWNKSPMSTKEDLEQAMFECEQWAAYAEDVKNGKNALEEIMGEMLREGEEGETGSSADDPAADVDDSPSAPEPAQTAPTKATEESRFSIKKGNKTYYFKTKKEAEDYAKKNWNWDATKVKKQLKDLGAKKYYVWAHKADYQEGDDVQPEHFGPYTKTYAKSYAATLRASDGYSNKYVGINTSSSEAPTKKPKKGKNKKYHWDGIEFREGGFANYTGPAVLHGSKTHPEAVLNAHQTEILRNDILSNKPNSLLNLLSEFQATAAKTANASTYNTIDRTKSTQIGSISLNMDVKQIANDYDARRAGEKAMEEMLRIARKTTATSIRG